MSKIESIIEHYDWSNWSGILTKQDLSSKSSKFIENYCNKHNLLNGEEILLIYDGSYLGINSNSIAITNKRLSFHISRLLGKSKTYSVEWNTLNKVTIVNGSIILTTIIGKSNHNFSSDEIFGRNRENENEFVVLLNSIARLDNSEYENQSKQPLIKWGVIVLAFIAFIGLIIQLESVSGDDKQLALQSYANDTEFQKLSINDDVSIDKRTPEVVRVAAPVNDSLVLVGDFNEPTSLKVTLLTNDSIVYSKIEPRQFNSKILIPETGIYDVELSTEHMNFGSVSILRQKINKSALNYKYSVAFDTVIGEKPFMNSMSTSDYTFTEVFSQPRKVTINSKGKKAFTGTGENRVVVPIEIPANTMEWIYRFSFSYRDQPQFHNSLRNDLYKGSNSLKDEGLLMSSLSNSSLATTMQIADPGTIIATGALDVMGVLYENLDKVPNEEAYLNYYLIDNEVDAKNFLEEDSFEYVLESSQRNIQSTTGRENYTDKRLLYLAFENNNLREQVYVEVQVTAVSVKSYYMGLIPTIKKF